MIGVALAIAAQMPAPAPAVFAPPLERPIAYTISEDRSGDGLQQRFMVERRAIFHRTADGLTADVTTLAVSGKGGGGTALFQAGMAALVGRTLHMRLDSAGRVLTIDDQATIWKAFSDGMIEHVGKAAPAKYAPLITALRDAPPAMQQRMLGGWLSSIVASDIAAAGTQPPRAVRLPVQGPGAPPGATIAGTERIDAPSKGILRVTRAAAGRLASGETIDMTITRDVDTAIGLITDQRDRIEIAIGTRRQIQDRRIVIHR